MMDKPKIDFSKLEQYSREATPVSSAMWEMRAADGKVYGPYATENFLTYAREGRILPDQYIRHPADTKGKWCLARDVKVVCEAMRQAAIQSNVTSPSTTWGPTAAQQPQFANPNHAQSLDLSKLNSTVRNRTKSKPLGFLEFFIVFLDPTFKHYLTPTLIRVTWCVVLLFLFFLVCFHLWTLVAVEPTYFDINLEKNRPRVAPTLDRLEQTSFLASLLKQLNNRIVLFVVNVVALILTTIWIRVFLECIIAIFDVSETLKRIESRP